MTDTPRDTLNEMFGTQCACFDEGCPACVAHRVMDERDAALNAHAVKPLVWEELSPRHFRAPAPLFGSVRVETYGDTWVVNWSVPGYCDTFVDGEFDGPEPAKAAAEAKYQRVLSALVPIEGDEG